MALNISVLTSLLLGWARAEYNVALNISVLTSLLLGRARLSIMWP